jgi:hypothetical protein
VRKPWFKLDVSEVDALTFRVESESGKSPYFIDAVADVCDCADFQCRIAPVRSGKKTTVFPSNFPDTCKHLMRVRLWIADRLLENIRKQKQFKPQTI